MVDLTNVLGGPWSPTDETRTDDAETQIRDAMASSGVEPPEDVHIDGKIHRFSTNGKKGDDAGWYVFYPDGVPSGAFGCWRDGVQQNWRKDIGRPLEAAEEMAIKRRQDEARKARQKEQEKRQESAQDTVDQIWRNAGGASDDHPYLKRKDIGANGARITGDGRLITPLFAPDGHLASLQYINSDGDKKYHSGAAVKSCQ